MKKIWVLAGLLVLITAVAAGCTTTGEGSVNPDADATPTATVQAVVGVQWLADWNEASNRAEADSKPVMINFYTDACPACRKLDQETFADADVSAFLNDNFVPLKSNAGKTSLYMNYGIRAVPTTVFVEPDGSEIARIVGYISADSFYQDALEVLERWQK